MAKKRPVAKSRPAPASRKKTPATTWHPYAIYALAVFLLLLLSLFFFRRARPPSFGEPWKEFSGAKALAQVQTIVDFGPRPPESKALQRTRTYIREQMEKNGWQVSEQPFTDRTPRGTVHFINLIARRRDQVKNKLFLIGSHYDTKTFDTVRFVGANDGGSSTGALIELGRVLALHPELARRVELVFFDGEEAYEHFTRTDGLYGSRYFAREIKKDGDAANYQGGIVWDMIGDRDLTITLPIDSPTEITTGIFAAADALGVRGHFGYSSGDMIDDHSPLNEIGIPTIDLIDFEYPPWHTAGDTMDKLSADSLQVIGQVTAYYLAKAAFP